MKNRIVCLSDQCKKKEITAFEGAVVYCYPQLFEIASCGFSIQAFIAFKQHTQWADMMHVFNRIKTPEIVTYQSDIIRQKKLLLLYKPLMYRFLKSMQKIVASSDNYLHSSDTLRLFKNKTVVIANGINAGPARDQQEQAKIQQQLKKKIGGAFFLFVGVLRYYKGLSYLLSALEGTNYTVVIAGSGPEEEALKQQAEELNLSHVFF